MNEQLDSRHGVPTQAATPSSTAKGTAARAPQLRLLRLQVQQSGQPRERPKSSSRLTPRETYLLRVPSRTYIILVHSLENNSTPPPLPCPLILLYDRQQWRTIPWQYASTKGMKLLTFEQPRRRSGSTHRREDAYKEGSYFEE